MARRAASISRAVMRAGSVVFRPKSPKATELPGVARPALRPLNILRYLVRFGCSIVSSSGGRFRGHRSRSCCCDVSGRLGATLELRLVEYFALEDPALHADDPVGGLGFG